MKKLIFTIAMFLLFTSAKSQINNLTDLLNLSELSVLGLTQELQGNWKISIPTEQYSEDRETVVGRYTYDFSKDGRDQSLERSITMDVKTTEKFEETLFISNEKELLTRIKRNLPNQGFYLKGIDDDVKIYEDGNRTITMQTEMTETMRLIDGYYAITVTLKNLTEK